MRLAKRRGDGEGCLVVILGAALLIMLIAGPNATRAERVAAEKEARDRRDEVATLWVRTSEQHEMIKDLQAKVKYLELREAAQVEINRATIEHGRKTDARLQAVEPRPHKVDDDKSETIPPTNLPTTPKDPD